VQTGSAFRGVVPFENSSNGSVVFTLDLFADLGQKYPDIVVCGESYISVQHCLLGHKQAATTTTTPNHHGASAVLASVIESPPSSGAVTPTSKDPRPLKPTAQLRGDISRIRKIYSHPQAWGQCKTFLNTYLKSVERQDVSSTSRAAELAAQDQSGCSAAVSSIIAARVHGLDVLAKGIEDRSDNTTRFFVLRKRAQAGPCAQGVLSLSAGKVESTKDSGSDDWKTLVSFTVDHANPGALAHSLAVFEKYGLNLTSINTRPSGVENWNYIFFVEIKGRKLEGEEEGAVNQALRDLREVCRGHRWLGSWENRLVR
jgi:prephenate dehydratase